MFKRGCVVLLLTWCIQARIIVTLIGVTLVAVLLHGCAGGGGSSNSGPTTPSGPTTSSATMFEGTIAGGSGESGVISLTIQTTLAASSIASLRSAKLTIKPLSFTQTSGTLNVNNGPSVTLAGAYDSTANTVSFSGGGFAFTGTISGAVLSGTYTSPNGSGVFSSLNSTQNSVTAYCGTFTSSSGKSGVWNLQVSAAGAVSGGFAQTSPPGSGGTFTGQVSGSTISGGNFTGTIQNGAVSGTYSAQDSGTFSGGACSIPAPPPAPAARGVEFLIMLEDRSGSFTGSLQSETLAGGTIGTTSTYDFILQPGTYTMTGQVMGEAGSNGGTPGILGVTFNRTSQGRCNSNSCPYAGVAPGIQSSITGGLGTLTQDVSSCRVTYSAQTCIKTPNGGCDVNANPRFLTFQLQFTVVADQPTPSTLCGG